MSDEENRTAPGRCIEWVAKLVEMSEFELQAEVAMFVKSGGDVRGLPATTGMLEIISLSHSLATIRSKHSQHSVAAAATLDFRRRLCCAEHLSITRIQESPIK